MWPSQSRSRGFNLAARLLKVLGFQPVSICGTFMLTGIAFVVQSNSRYSLHNNSVPLGCGGGIGTPLISRPITQLTHLSKPFTTTGQTEHSISYDMTPYSWDLMRGDPRLPQNCTSYLIFVALATRNESTSRNNITRPLVLAQRLQSMVWSV